LVGAGFLATAYALYEMVKWTPDVSEWTLIQTGFIQGLGTSCISVPLATVAFATLPTELRAEGAGIFSLLRNLGSSIGISITAALLTTNTQINHAVIAAAVTPFSRSLQSGAALKFWNPAAVQGAAALDQEITRQAVIIAYADDFKLMFILTLVAMPLVLLLRTARAKTP
jgi:DHA2 family multidrug resistance protein